MFNKEQATWPRPYGLILTGGQSRRMGRDKAVMLGTDGRPQLARLYELLSLYCEQVFVSVRGDQAGELVRARFPQIVDEWDGVGPVGGILAALRRAPDVAWLVVACDLPQLDGVALAALLAARFDALSVMSSCQSDAGKPPLATVYRGGDGTIEPLCAIYEPGMRAVLERGMRNGVLSPKRLLEGVRVTSVPVGASRALRNVNSPEDLTDLDQ